MKRADMDAHSRPLRDDSRRRLPAEVRAEALAKSEGVDTLGRHLEAAWRSAA